MAGGGVSGDRMFYNLLMSVMYYNSKHWKGKKACDNKVAREG